MLQSFYTAFTGLSADKKWLSIISDNIANVNTVGYKAENAVFEDLLARSLTTFKNGAPVNQEVGGGVFVSATVKDFSQGTFKNTNNPLDLALDGEGFFIVKDQSGTTYYTRNGQFRLDANGDLINMLGMKVQGWMLDENGNLSGDIGSVNVPMDMDPKSTTYVKFKAPTNLDSRSPFIVDNPDTADINESLFNPADSNTYNYVNSMTVYDSLGNPHTLSFFFVHKQDENGKSYWLTYSQIDGITAPIKKGVYDYAFIKYSFRPDGTLDEANIRAYGEISKHLDVNFDLEGELSGDKYEYNIDNITAKIDDTTYDKFTDLIPGTVKVYFKINGNNVILRDDGNGRLYVVEYENNNEKVGELWGNIDYITGKITITADGKIDDNDEDEDNLSDINVDFKAQTTERSSISEIQDGLFKLPLGAQESTLPGSVEFDYVDALGKTVHVYDDGRGNLIDKLTGIKKGTVNYTTGAIVIPELNNDSQDKILNVRFKVYQNSESDGRFYDVDTNLTGVVVSKDEVGDTSYSGDSVILFTLSNRPIYKIPPEDLSDTTYPLKIGGKLYKVNQSGNYYDIIDPDNNDIVGRIDPAAGKLWLYPDKLNVTTIDYIYYEPFGVKLDPKKITTDFVDFKNGADKFSISLNLLNLKQVASDFMFYTEQDGNSKGDLTAVSVSEDGIIRASYTNGKVRDIARLAVATFKDKEMLVRKGSWLYVPNVQTYTPVIMPGGIISKIRSGMLEMSNVDIANEFINLITAQRSYQANARVITTDDQILQETMNIKR